MLPCCAPPQNAIAKFKIPANLGLKHGDYVSFSGKLTGLDQHGVPTLQCNPEDISKITPPSPASHDLITPIDPNRTYVQGLGIVMKREELRTEPPAKNPPIMFTVKHTLEGDQAKQAGTTFKVRYIASTTLLQKSHVVIQKGCEISIAGYLMNSPFSQDPWLVETVGISLLKNPPRFRKKEMKVPKKLNEKEKNPIEGSLPSRKVILPKSECCCKVDRGEGSSSGATLDQRAVIQSGTCDVIANFSSLDIKGKSKEIS
ncbi:hypothetical protein PCASD_11884 [Puccinia coronata f. sp. avenae]|uniref:Uncharacterized protein n=1 Tax=Puccinia coronata f. sp. avenae TaxID=200324 RepID=A0A2N5TAZ8_9BASI|nr:hypothetical protein PCASD_11884 [Puccinia coronata f. sp. avenae]